VNAAPTPGARTLEEELQTAEAILQQQAQRLEKLKRLQRLQVHLEKAKEEFERELQREELSRRIEDVSDSENAASEAEQYEDGISQVVEETPAPRRRTVQPLSGAEAKPAAPAARARPASIESPTADRPGYARVDGSSPSSGARPNRQPTGSVLVGRR
jgi:type II secretory pathway component HofQ